MDTNPHINATPLPFDPAFEVPEAHEAETLAGLMDTLHGISESTFKHSGHAIRSVHAKSHGLLRGELRCWTACPPRWRRASSRGPEAGPW